MTYWSTGHGSGMSHEAVRTFFFLCFVMVLLQSSILLWPRVQRLLRWFREDKQT